MKMKENLFTSCYYDSKVLSELNKGIQYKNMEE